MAEKIALNVNEVAEFIGISRTTVYQKVREGVIPHTRLGSRIIFHRGVIESWLRGDIPEQKHERS